MPRSIPAPLCSKTTAVPSGVNAWGYWLSRSPNGSTSPVPSAALKDMGAPAEPNATRAPSGVHAGKISAAGSKVSRVEVLRARS